MSTPIILIHGYSDKGRSFLTWKKRLEPLVQGRPVHVVSYRTLTNEVTIRDIAEAFDRALKVTPGLEQGQEFDAIVHSTGMLVIRAWLTTYVEERVSRLKRLIGLAPATFGSPLASAGRSTLGALFKGNKEWGPDFLEAGDAVLDGLELASRFTWDLAHQDILPDEVSGRKPLYGADNTTPYVFIFCGNKAYGGLRSFVNKPGTDGTVRWAGCALNARKIVLDLTHDPEEAKKAATGADTIDPERFEFSPRADLDIPVTFVDDVNHGSIIEDPPDDLVDKVAAALQVNSAQDYDNWVAVARQWSAPARPTDEYQQFVIHARDERGDGIPDFSVQVGVVNEDGEFEELEDFDLAVHPYTADKSFRCFHVNLTKLRANQQDPNELCINVIASTGTQLVAYLGHGNRMWPGNLRNTNSAGMGMVTYDLAPVLTHKEGTLFYPFTTTLVELVLNREPMPPDGINEVCWMLKTK